jgi:hypothetical protein
MLLNAHYGCIALCQKVYVEVAGYAHGP